MAHLFGPAAAINLVICLLLGYRTRSRIGGDIPGGFKEHLSRYLIAWTFCIAGEWFCGPGVYALYAEYGFSSEQIAQLFVLGFAWSSILGCFAGGFADTFGRKRSALLFCTFGVLSCTCKHFPYYPILLVGRVLDGAHASLLYTVFESWLVSEHFTRHGFAPDLLGHSFAMMYTISYVVAILCGLIAQVGVDALSGLPRLGGMHFGGWRFPWEMSAICQLTGGLYIARNWDENHGAIAPMSSDGVTCCGGTLTNALSKPGVLACFALVTFFESSMFIFVFSWTPALAAGSDPSQLPCGLIFATYMMACMSGASLYSLCPDVEITHVILAITGVAAVALAVPAIGGTSKAGVDANFAAFVLYELCVGAYFPAAAKMKSEFVEEHHRTTIYNLFRTPMNCIVVAVLLASPSLVFTFRLLCTMVALSAVAIAGFCAYSDVRDCKEIPLLNA